MPPRSDTARDNDQDWRGGNPNLEYYQSIIKRHAMKTETIPEYCECGLHWGHTGKHAPTEAGAILEMEETCPDCEGTGEVWQRGIGLAEQDMELRPCHCTRTPAEDIGER